MKPQEEYKSFNSKKSIEELQYIMLQYNKRLLELETEQNFYNFLIGASVFKNQILNVFEILEQFKNELNINLKTIRELLDKVDSQIDLISKKIECDNLLCDSFFVREYDDLELEIYSFFQNISDFKSQFFSYMESTIKS
ncbi:hypothetical protein RXV94_06005 [Yeosuana sp. MJ-SS3]|uniref:Uncharacterized protein n=1 Tax=Gilvirhabdus luticola TaxID=3079858 RepID=A0ABU3U5L8_9FLAO|nr:hypothetical protein [Yeosuana sp. MJ-SS3]MDU8885706.1 hypothetical protein [Yeosuana sp. MJ-SS3]